MDRSRRQSNSNRSNNSTGSNSNRSYVSRSNNSRARTNRRPNNNHRASNNHVSNHRASNNRQTTESSDRKCNMCGTYHAVKSCRKFLAMQFIKRQQYVETNRYCTNCLARSHDFRACPSEDRCRICDGFHHTLLHPKRRSITTKQLRNRKRLSQKNKPKHQQPKHQQHPTRSTVPNTRVISEAIKSLAAVLCVSE